METIPCTIDVTIGADTMQVNGKSYPLDVPAYINDAGYTMLPMRALVENLPGEVQKKVVWDGQSKTALILCGMTTYRLTAGEKEALRNGDKLICRQNDWSRSVDGNIYLTTGMSGIVTDINRGLGEENYMSINFQPDICEDEFFNLRLDLKYIRSNYEDRKLYGISSYEKFEYGYCITVHQSQGSGWNNVLFIDHYFHDIEYLRRVRYTAITRAIYGLTMAEEVVFTDNAA